MKYMVMECHPGYVIVLDEEGRFLKAANFQYEVGEIIENPVLMRKKPIETRRFGNWVRASVIAAAACVLLFFGFGYYQTYMVTYSSVYLTINPQVQMDLNRQGTVIRLIGTNEDGKTLLEGYDGKGKDKITVADELIDRAIEMGFLSSGGRVSFSIDAPDEVVLTEYGVEFRTKITEYLDERMEVVIQITDHKAENGSESSLSPSSSSSQSSGETSQSSQGDSSSGVYSVAPPVSSAASSGGYGDTDYLPSGSTDYVSSSGDTDYSSNYTDYSSNHTDYASSANSSSQKASDYDDGATDYDPEHSNETDDED